MTLTETKLLSGQRALLNMTEGTDPHRLPQLPGASFCQGSLSDPRISEVPPPTWTPSPGLLHGGTFGEQHVSK